MGDRDAAKEAGWPWRDYWRSGQAGVAGDGTCGTEAGKTDAAWLPWFADALDRARVLDLCTGGGAVLRHAAQAAGRSFELIGVDEATLAEDPSLVALGIRRIGETSIDALPFPDGAFDVVTSQFGVEYADHGRALAEVARVTRPSASVRFLLHHAHSEITRQARAGLAAYDAVIGDGRLVDQCRAAYASRLNGAAELEAAAQAQALRASILAVAARVGADPALSTTRYMLSYINDLAMGVDRYSPMSALQCIQDFKDRNAAWRERHRLQVAAAMDSPALDAFLAICAQNRLSLRSRAEWRDPVGGLMGWLVDLSRDADGGV
ncbi:class I SAM-dependent methyltransferase [Brevundimonas sp. VNH65]|uniref:class I SAM-dependent methyltransferase n=1 Tax=Brevundimonas sp. VNH65 TaxID=3400917 RepID=UPI003C017A13